MPKWGPQLVATHVPPEERNDALYAAFAGKDVPVRPRFYVSYETQRAEIKARTQPLASLYEKHAEAASLIEAMEQKIEIPLNEVRWLPLKHKNGFWTALIDSSSGTPIGYLELDPY